MKDREGGVYRCWRVGEKGNGSGSVVGLECDGMVEQEKEL